MFDSRWERILDSQIARRLRTILLGRPHKVVVDVPYRRDDPRLGDDDIPTVTATTAS